MEEFLSWIDTSPFFGKNALAKAAEYTLSGAMGLKAFLDDGHLEIDNNPAENAIRPNVIGRKNWLFSVSEAGAKANAICLSLAETAKANGIDFLSIFSEADDRAPNFTNSSAARTITCLGRKISKLHVQNNESFFISSCITV